LTNIIKGGKIGKLVSIDEDPPPSIVSLFNTFGSLGNLFIFDAEIKDRPVRESGNFIKFSVLADMLKLLRLGGNESNR
jgi:hypothetical protein